MRHLFDLFVIEELRAVLRTDRTVSAEYCGRPVHEGQQRCRDIGALKQWTLRQAGNDAFKAYRKEYKKRFAWIKAGRITDRQFTIGVT